MGFLDTAVNVVGGVVKGVLGGGAGAAAAGTAAAYGGAKAAGFMERYLAEHQENRDQMAEERADNPTEAAETQKGDNAWGIASFIDDLFNGSDEDED